MESSSMNILRISLKVLPTILYLSFTSSKTIDIEGVIIHPKIITKINNKIIILILHLLFLFHHKKNNNKYHRYN